MKRRQLSRRENVAFSDVFYVFGKNIGLIIFCILVAILLAVAYLKVTPPTYRASAQLLLEPKPPQIFRDASDFSLSGEGGQIETHMVALRARGIASAVVTKLNLTDDEEFRANAPASPTWVKTLAFWRTPKERVEVGGQRLAVDILQERTVIEREGISQVINLSFSSEDPKKSAVIVNAIAQAYVESLLEVRANAARAASEWLEERLARLRVQMNASAERAKNFRANKEFATLEEIELTADTYRKVYQNFYSAFTEAVQRESYPVSTIRVISAASVPRRRSQPQPALVFGLAVVLGGGFGLLVAIMRESSRAQPPGRLP